MRLAVCASFTVTASPTIAKAAMFEVRLDRQAEAISSPVKEASGSRGPLWVNVSLDDQSLRLFDGTNVIEQSNISSGKSGHDTPTGVFSILGKKKYHESNIYSSAPMPYMQRLTWSGIALHESGSVPPFPASHGCVRLPEGFASTLYKLTPHGTHVIISNEAVYPGRVDHPSLFQPANTNYLPKTLPMVLRPSVVDPLPTGGIEPVKLPDITEPDFKSGPLRIYVTRTTGKGKIAHLQRMLSKLNFYSGEKDGIFGKATIQSLKAFQKAHSIGITGKISDETIERLQILSGLGDEPAAMIYVRQNRAQVFEMPVELKDPDKPLGTHLLLSTAHTSTSTGWIAVNIASRIPASILRSNRMDDALKGVRLKGDSIDILDRIIIPQEAREFIEARLGEGSSYAISDNGMGTETGDGTDFIVQTF